MIASQRSSARRVAQVHLVAELRAPSGARDHHWDALELGLLVPVVALAGDVVSKLAHERLRRGPWICSGDVGLADLDVHAGERLHPERVQQGVAVGEQKPEWSSASFSRIRSFTMPPSSAQISTYLHCSGRV